MIHIHDMISQYDEMICTMIFSLRSRVQNSSILKPKKRNRISAAERVQQYPGNQDNALLVVKCHYNEVRDER